MVTHFAPVQPGWKVQFEGLAIDGNKAVVWLPLLGWLITDDTQRPVEPCVWWGGLSTAQGAADDMEYSEWSVVEQDYAETEA